MAERSSYAPGTPSWIDIGVPDIAVAAAFYGGLFAWTAEIDPRPEAGGYGIFRLRGKDIAGVGPQQNSELPPYWTVYVTVENADTTAAAVTANGGTVLMEPTDVVDAGRMAVCQDPGGSYISIWQSGAMIGSQLVNEAGAFVWNELATTDVARAREFYQAVFGWGLNSEGSGDNAALFTLGGEPLCGAHTAGEGEFPAWSVWFAVDDCDAAAAKAVALGGTVLMPPNDMDFGRGAMIADPAGAVFGVGAMAGLNMA